MQSPYFNGSGGGVSFMPPHGLAEILSQREKDTVSELGSIGKVAGGLAAGGIGAFQGAANPGVFGGATPASTDSEGGYVPATPGTSPASGAMQGFAANYQHAMGGGGSSFADMVQGNGPSSGGGGGGAPPNFKQLQLQGKAADSMWK